MLVGLDVPSAVEGTEAWGPIPTSGQLSESEEKHLRLSETADLWQPKWSERQSLLHSYIPWIATQIPWKVQWLGAGV